MLQTKKGEKSPFNKTKIIVYLSYKLKAIHNKDYSVVKTFTTASVYSGVVFICKCFTNTLKKE